MHAKTFIFLAGLTALLLVVGTIMGGKTGLIITIILSAVMNLTAYWSSDKLVLSLYGAEEVSQNSELYSIVKGLALSANLPMPKVYIINEAQPNAFATGRNPENAAVAATTGILDLLSKDELAGVMAHELAHIKNRDTLIQTVSATIAGAISMLTSFLMLMFGSRESSNAGFRLLAMIFAPIAAMILQMAISRSREYMADEEGAKICGNPLSLANALSKMSNKAKNIPNNVAQDVPSTAAMFIINPLIGGKDWFSTHPATEKRIALLEEMAKNGNFSKKSNRTSIPTIKRSSLPKI